MTVNISEQNARLNENSTDQSTNVAASGDVKVFRDLREAIEKEIPEPHRAGLLDGLEALENSHGSESFRSRYKEFMALAADHASVLGPFLAGLALFL